MPTIARAQSVVHFGRRWPAQPPKRGYAAPSETRGGGDCAPAGMRKSTPMGAREISAAERPRDVIGVVHLPALPGDPGNRDPAAGFGPVFALAMADAAALAEGGCTAIVVENFGSAPFAKGVTGDRMPPHQLAALSIVASRCAAQLSIPVGVNCLRNDGPAAVAIAAAAGLSFVRINVHVGAYVTDQGLIEGEAAATLRYRDALGARGVAIWADVLVKHAAPLAPISATEATKDCIARGMADAVIVTGSATGGEVPLDQLRAVAAAAGDTPVLIGSGLTEANAETLAPWGDAAIVGTALKRGGVLAAPVDVARVRRLVEATRAQFGTAKRGAHPSPG